MTTPNTDIEVMKAMASLFRKKAAVMKALEGGIAKSGSNTHFNYKFMTASEIKHIVGGLFADNGLSLQMSGVATENAISKVERKEGPPKEVPILRIQFAISLCDMDTGAVEQSFWFGEAQATDDKAASKCATSALKYFLISNLMIADKEEDKRDTDRGPRRQQPAQTQQAAPAPAPVKASDAPAEYNANLLRRNDATRWGKLLEWADKNFSMGQDDIEKALWRIEQKPFNAGDSEQVMGAILAAHCDYDSESIEKRSEGKGFKPNVLAHAALISDRIPY